MKAKVSIVGLGRIGFPIALILKKQGFDVSGVDIDKAVLKKQSLFDEPGIKELFSLHPIPIYTKPRFADIHLIAVPTPLNSNYKADLSFLNEAIESLIPILKKRDLILIESTCPIGTTEKIAKKVPHAHLAYCPERVLPGNILHELIHNDRIIGGIDPVSTEKGYAFYASFIKGKVIKTNAKTAEGVKLAENAFRDVNIAFANELSMIASNVGISHTELIDLANHHPRVNILKPGPGVGGHCIPIDPYFLIEGSPKQSKLIAAAREVNKQKETWVLDQIKSKIQKHQCKKIVCLGLTYKANVNDFRESPALSITDTLKREFNICSIDPFFNPSDSIEGRVKDADMVVTLVAHDCFKEIPDSILSGKVTLDFAGVF